MWQVEADTELTLFALPATTVSQILLSLAKFISVYGMLFHAAMTQRISVHRTVEARFGRKIDHRTVVLYVRFSAISCACVQ